MHEQHEKQMQIESAGYLEEARRSYTGRSGHKGVLRRPDTRYRQV